MAWTTPTTRSTGDLISASIWNTDLVNNLAYLKDSPTFDGSVTATGQVTCNFAGTSLISSQDALINTNNKFLYGRNTSAVSKRLIGLNSSDKVAIDTDAVGAVFGAGATFAGAVSTTSTLALAATSKLYLDGVAASGDTYIQESAANTLSFFSGGAEAKLTSGVLTVTTASAASTHTFTGSVNGDITFKVANTTAGDSARAILQLTTNSANQAIFAFDDGYSTSGRLIAGSMLLENGDVGGITLSASHASGPIRFYSGGTSLRWGINAAGDWTFGTSSHIADSNGTPSIASGGGTSPTIAGADYAFVITVGTSPGSTDIVINFGHTYDAAPIPTIGYLGGKPVVPKVLAVTTTSMTLQAPEGFDSSFGWTAGDKVYVHVKGY